MTPNLSIIGNVSKSTDILMLNGENDIQTPVQQAFVLQQRLTEVNHPDHTLITYPKLYDGAKSIELSECLFCFHVYNRSVISLQQVLVHDMDYCPSCWQKEIMNKEYQEEDPLDIQIKKFWSGKIDYRQVINS